MKLSKPQLEILERLAKGHTVICRGYKTGYVGGYKWAITGKTLNNETVRVLMRSCLIEHRHITGDLYHLVPSIAPPGAIIAECIKEKNLLIQSLQQEYDHDACNRAIKLELKIANWYNINRDKQNEFISLISASSLCIDGDSPTTWGVLRRLRTLAKTKKQLELIEQIHQSLLPNKELLEKVVKRLRESEYERVFPTHMVAIAATAEERAKLKLVSMIFPLEFELQRTYGFKINTQWEAMIKRSREVINERRETH